MQSDNLGYSKYMILFGNKSHNHDPLWHVQITLLGVIILQILLPDNLNALPKYILPTLELLCLVVLQFVTPKTPIFSSKIRRLVAIILIVLIAVANASSLQLLIHALFEATKADAPSLLIAAVSIYVTNVVIFGLLYWEMDGGGPGIRRTNDTNSRDFLFPQQNLSYKQSDPWHPTFVDYLYVSVTNATAFSPTDTLPLTRRSKMIMGGQAFLSLLVVALVAARAINIL